MYRSWDLLTNSVFILQEVREEDIQPPEDEITNMMKEGEAQISTTIDDQATIGHFNATEIDNLKEDEVSKETTAVMNVSCSFDETAGITFDRNLDDGIPQEVARSGKDEISLLEPTSMNLTLRKAFLIP